MSSVLQIVDAAGVVQADLNGSNGVAMGSVTIETMHRPDLGAPATEFTRYEYGSRDGGTTTRRRAGLTPFSLPIRIVHTAYDNKTLAVNRLAELLAAGCIMRWIPDTSANTRYIVVEPSSTPVLLDGREFALQEATAQFASIEGITLNLFRQPFLYGAELDPTLNKLTNATLLIDTDQNGRPEGWTWSSATNITNEQIIFNGKDSCFRFNIATGSQRKLLQTPANGTVAAGEVWTFSGYVRVPAVLGGPKCQAIIEWHDSGAAITGTSTGTLTALTTEWARLTVSGTAPASTVTAEVGLRMDNDDATAVDVEYRCEQFEKSASASVFRVGVETANTDPAVSPGRRSVLWIEGDTRAPVRCYWQGSSTSVVIAGIAPASKNLNYGYKQAEAMTQGTNTATATIGATASGTGADASETTFGSLNTLAPTRLTWTLSANELAGVVGQTVLVWFRVRQNNGQAMSLQVSYDYGIGIPGAWGTLPAVTFVPTQTAIYHDVLLGRLTVPDDAAGLRLYFYCRNDAGTGIFNWDVCMLTPLTSILAATPTRDTGWTLLETDPEIPRVGGVDSNHLLGSLGISSGPVPFIAEPGPNTVYATEATADSAGLYPSNTFVTRTRQFHYAPRYYS